VSTGGEYAADDRWAPIIVDRAVLPFSPRPAPHHAYRPDTIVDGWSTPEFTVRLASTRGYAHRYDGTPRQDDAVVAVHAGTGAVVFAVADGVSAAPQSHVGARLACRTAVDAVIRALDERGAVDWTSVVEATAIRLTRHAGEALGTSRPDVAAAERLLATTLVAGTVEPDPSGPIATLVQAGDSGAWLLQAGRFEGLLTGKTDPDSPVFSSAVAALPRVTGHVRPFSLRLPADATLLVGTDGFGDPLGDRSGLVGDLFRRVLSDPPPPLGLAHALDFSRETFDDDRTLLAVWPAGHVRRHPSRG
jgi:hypothetical protein